MNTLRKIQTTTTPVNNTNYKSNKLTCGTLFSGIGSFEQSLKNLNIDHTNEYMCEINKFSRETYLENHSVNNVYEDITKLNTKTIPKVDLLVWGSPCQSFSIQGYRGGLEDTRGTLVFNGLEVIQKTQPSYFIFENVKGMINHDSGQTFDTILNSFEELNYKIKYQVLNSKNFGTPQNRERLFIVGIRNDINQEFEFPTPQPVTKCVNDFIKDGVDYSNYIFDSSKIQPFTQKRVTDIKKTHHLPHLNYESDRRVMSTNGISSCFLSGGLRGRFHDTKNNIFRHLTEQELTEIQGFPSDFKFPVSNSQIRKQIGNSIYVGVLEEILKNLIPQHINNEVEEDLRLVS